MGQAVGLQKPSETSQGLLTTCPARDLTRLMKVIVTIDQSENFSEQRVILEPLVGEIQSALEEFPIVLAHFSTNKSHDPYATWVGVINIIFELTYNDDPYIVYDGISDKIKDLTGLELLAFPHKKIEQGK